MHLKMSYLVELSKCYIFYVMNILSDCLYVCVTLRVTCIILVKAAEEG